MSRYAFSTVLFDLDGTLFDTAPALSYALNCLLEKHQHEPLTFEAFLPHASGGTPQWIEMCFGVHVGDPSYDALRAEYLQIYQQCMSSKTAFYPGIENVLTDIENTGRRWGVVTNKTKYLAQQLMDQFQLSDRLGCLIGGDTLVKRKPDPEPLLHACELMHVKPDECVYVGDEKRDIDAANAAGMKSIAVLYGYNHSNENPKEWNANFYAARPEEINLFVNSS